MQTEASINEGSLNTPMNEEFLQKDNLNLFSDRLACDLKKILESLYGVKPSEVELQEIGRRIMQFVLIQEGMKHTRRKRDGMSQNN